MWSKLVDPPAAIVCGDLNMLRCFTDSGIPVVVVTSDPRDVTLRSRYCRASCVIAPPADAERAIAELESLGKSHVRRPVLYYGTDAMLQLVSRHRERLQWYFDFRMPSEALIEDLVDKARFSRLAERAGLPVPPALACTHKTPATEALEAVGLPCAYKPSVHIGWLRSVSSIDGKPRKALVARTREELFSLHELVKQHAESFLVQRYVGGGEDRIYSYHAYLDANGAPLGEFAGKKLRTYPMEAGISTCLELVREPRVIDLGRSVCSKLGVVGPVKLDFKRDPIDERFYLFEINPRFSLWNRLGAACGVNLPAIAYADLVGERVTPIRDYRTGVKWLSFGDDFRTFVRDYHPRGELSLAAWLSTYRGEMVYDVFSWRDPLPLGACMVHYGKALVDRIRRHSNGTSSPRVRIKRSALPSVTGPGRSL